ncbi:hypothetical protein OF83DRAFT_1108738 [Amylostereum chailletii]|nr:hypothetical protein OF83DRAFT_1108738 [Amylostereum chailletii]
MSDSLYLQQSTRLSLAIQRLQSLAEQARVPFTDALVTEVVRLFTTISIQSSSPHLPS